MKKQLTFPILLLLFVSLISVDLSAQNYKMAAGLRVGLPTSASFKYFLNESSAVEAYVGIRGYSAYRWINLSGAYLHHKDLDILDGLQYYIGGGASVFFWSFDNIFIGDNSTTTTFGIQGYGGLDYTFDDIPLNLSVDWTPTVFINGYGSGFGGGYATAAARYIISR